MERFYRNCSSSRNQSWFDERLQALRDLHADHEDSTYGEQLDAPNSVAQLELLADDGAIGLSFTILETDSQCVESLEVAPGTHIPSRLQDGLGKASSLGIDEFVQLVDDPHRSAPIVVAPEHPRRPSAIHQQLIDELQKSLAGVAHLITLNADAAQQLSGTDRFERIKPGSLWCEKPQTNLPRGSIERDLAGASSAIKTRILRASPFHRLGPKIRQLISKGPARSDGGVLLDEAAALEDEVVRLRTELDDTILELTAAESSSSALEATIRRLQRLLAESGNPDYVIDEPEEPESLHQAVSRARSELNYLSIPSSIYVPAELDQHERSQLWATRLWEGLCALNDFAKNQNEEGRRTSDFMRFCDDPLSPDAHTFPPNRVAMRESESTMSVASCAAERTFAVPIAVDESGQVIMASHLKIEKGGYPAPRVHFYDDTRGSTKKVHIGYIGHHLSTE